MTSPANRTLASKHIKEWLWFSIIVAAIGLYWGYRLEESHQRLETRERERLTEQCKVVEMNLSRQFDAIDAALQSIVSNVPDWRKQKDGTHLATQHLTALNDAMPGVLTLMVFDADGIVRASDKQELVGMNFASREYFQSAKRDANPSKLYVNPPLTTKLGNFTMNLVRIVPDSKGAFDGMVLAALDAEEFKVLLKSVLYRPEVRAALIHGDGVPFLMAPGKKNIDGLNLVQPGGFFTRHIQSGNVISVQSGKVAADEEDRLIALQTIQPQLLKMDKPMVISLERPMSAIFFHWRKDVYVEAVLYVLLALTAAVTLAIQQRRRISDLRAEIRHEAQREADLQALRESEDRFRRMTRLSSDWYWEQDDQFRFVRLHGDVDPKTKAANDIHVGKTRWEMGALNLTQEDWDKHRQALLRHEEFHDLEMQRMDADGKIQWLSTSGMPVFDSQGVFQGYQGVGKNITASESVQDRIKRLAFYDGLTNLPNRRLLNDRLALAMATSRRTMRFGALLFVDLDDFKPINDQHGHEVGDQLLIEVANRLRVCVREIDTAARFGGDEFVVVVSDLDSGREESLTHALAVAEKIRVKVAEPFALRIERMGKKDSIMELRCSASIGLTLFGSEDSDADVIIKRADAAMYQAKATGRNAVEMQ